MVGTRCKTSRNLYVNELYFETKDPRDTYDIASTEPILQAKGQTVKMFVIKHIYVQVAETLGSMSIKYRTDMKISDRRRSEGL